ncbi:unnamed protein product, partial [Pleuronectes platessa]
SPPGCGKCLRDPLGRPLSPSPATEIESDNSMADSRDPLLHEETSQAHTEAHSPDERKDFLFTIPNCAQRYPAGQSIIPVAEGRGRHRRRRRRRLIPFQRARDEFALLPV